MAATALLAFTLLLAAQLTYSRSSDTLGFVVRPPGWQASFRAPRGFESGALFQSGAMQVLRFTMQRADDTGVDLLIWQVRLDEQVSTVDRVARQILEASTAADSVGGVTPAPVAAKKELGDRPGLELLAGDSSALVRVALVNAHTAFAVSLVVHQAPIPDDLYSLFDRICKSFRFEGISRGKG